MPNYTKPVWIVLNPKGEPMPAPLQGGSGVANWTVKKHAQMRASVSNRRGQGYRCVKATLSWEEA